jgi:hypothetical protein
MNHSEPTAGSSAQEKLSGGDNEKTAKEKRLADALRKNLLRRKACAKTGDNPAEGSR